MNNLFVKHRVQNAVKKATIENQFLIAVNIIDHAFSQIDSEKHDEIKKYRKMVLDTVK